MLSDILLWTDAHLLLFHNKRRKWEPSWVLHGRCVSVCVSGVSLSCRGCREQWSESSLWRWETGCRLFVELKGGWHDCQLLCSTKSAKHRQQKHTCESGWHMCCHEHASPWSMCQVCRLPCVCLDESSLRQPAAAPKSQTMTRVTVKGANRAILIIIKLNMDTLQCLCLQSLSARIPATLSTTPHRESCTEA